MRIATRCFVIALAITALAGAVHGQTLYAVTEGDSWAGGIAELRTVNPATCEVVTTVGTITVAGGTLYNVRGIAMDPISGAMYGLISSSLGNLFGTYDLATAVFTVIWQDDTYTYWLRDLTFDAAGQLYVVSGNDGPSPNTLYAMDKATGALTLKTVVSGTNQHGIAFNPATPGVLYHAYGDGDSYDLESVDLATNALTQLGQTSSPSNSRFGIVWDPDAGLFRVHDTGDSWATLSPTGTLVATGSTCSTAYFGLAFDQDTTVPVELMQLEIE